MVAIPMAILLLVLASLPTAASSGVVGRWSLIDTSDYPGATCVFHNFNPQDNLFRIRVRAPVIYAINSTPGRDTETVGWRWIIQSSTDSGQTWPVVAKGPIAKAFATDTYNAQWKSLTSTWNLPSNSVAGAFRVQVVAFWYTKTGATRSTDRQLVLHYVDRYGGQDHELNTFCGDTLG